SEYPDIISNRKYLEHNNCSDKDLIHIFEKCKEAVPNNILLNYVANRLIDSYDDLWNFRKYFTTQLGISSLIQYLFSISNVTPENFYVLLESSQIYNHDFYAPLDDNGRIKENTHVP